ncbi:C10 family peptidase [uncultured Parabacteroides sp.]|uniref:C10 family peptidase n=1 Tax=uncultured Parabacteroides sp. TaxID=512312 RepID=UPI002804FB76|nr:C10 family peptidase [uncultured Parabacteroides sp.]
MKKSLFFLFLFLLPFSLAAERINMDKAYVVAKNVLLQTENSLRSSSELVLAYKACSNNGTNLRASELLVDFYVFNVKAGNGFVIVAGDDCVSPVLGYSEEGTFDAASMPENLKVWLQGYQEEINFAIQNGGKATEEIRAEWQRALAVSRQTFSGQNLLLETATWGQDDPYNRMCPTIGGQKAPAGCCATAMAILMKYHRYPEQANATNAVSSYRDILVSYRKYDWNSMPNSLNSASEDQKNVVAELMWQCGANVKMNYRQTESSAYVDDVVTALQDVFGYSKQMKHLYQDFVGQKYSWDEWEQMLHNELDNGRPVLYGAETETRQDPFHGIAHSFICDGYDSYGRYHFNWGWNGLHNGFYVLSVLDPKNNNVWGGYNRSHEMVMNIMPNKEAENHVLLQLYESAQGDGFEVNRLDGKWEDIVTFCIENKGNAPFEGYIGYARTDAQGNIKKVGQISECSLDVVYSNKLTVGFIVAMEENENVMAAYSTDKEHWTVIKGASPDIADRCNIKGPVSDQKVYYDWEFDCRGNGLTLEAPEKLEYNKDVTVKLIAKHGFTLPKASDISIQVAHYQSISINSTWELKDYATYNEQTGELYISRIFGHLYIAAEGLSTGEDVWWKEDASLMSLSYVLNGSSNAVSLNSEWQSYTVLLPSGLTGKPLITLEAEANQNGATVEITNPVWLDNMAIGYVKVISVSGDVNRTYSVLFKLSGSTEDPVEPDVPDDQTLTISSGKTLTGVKVETINIDSPTRIIAPTFNGVETQRVNITKGTDVRIVLNNQNSLGIITNDGDLQLLSRYGDGFTSFTSFVNNGTLIDITGFITKVEGKAALEVFPLKATKKGNLVVLEGQALPGENGNVVVEWSKAGENESFWNPIQTKTYRSNLRSSSINETVTVTEPGIYRMSVVNTVDGVSNFLVSLIKVSVSDIETDNAKVTKDKVAVYGKDGILHIHALLPSTAYIFSIDGRLAKIQPFTAGDIVVNLSRGQYVVRIDRQVFKVVL